jgi:hypothetical protein
MVKFAADARAQRNLNTNNAIEKKKAEDAEVAALQAPEAEQPTKRSKPTGTGDGYRIKHKEKVVKKKNKKKDNTPLLQATETEAEDQPEYPSDPLSENQTNPSATEGPKVRSSHVPTCTYPMHTKHELWKIHSSENQKALSPNDTKSKDKVPGHTRH